MDIEWGEGIPPPVVWNARSGIMSSRIHDSALQALNTCIGKTLAINSMPSKQFIWIRTSREKKNIEIENRTANIQSCVYGLNWRTRWWQMVLTLYCMIHYNLSVCAKWSHGIPIRSTHYFAAFWRVLASFHRVCFVVQLSSNRALSRPMENREKEKQKLMCALCIERKCDNDGYMEAKIYRYCIRTQNGNEMNARQGKILIKTQKNLFPFEILNGRNLSVMFRNGIDILEWRCEAVFPTEPNSFCPLSTCPCDAVCDSIPNESLVYSMIHCERKNRKIKQQMVEANIHYIQIFFCSKCSTLSCHDVRRAKMWIMDLKPPTTNILDWCAPLALIYIPDQCQLKTAQTIKLHKKSNSPEQIGIIMTAAIALQYTSHLSN